MPSMPGPKTIRLVAAGLAVFTAAVLARGIYQIIPMGDPLPRSEFVGELNGPALASYSRVAIQRFGERQLLTGQLLVTAKDIEGLAQAPVRQEPLVAQRAIEPATDRGSGPMLDPVLAEPAPLQPEMAADLDTSEFAEIERLAGDLRAAGAAAKKVTVLGTAPGDAITLSTLTLARNLARDARVVVVDLAASSPTIAAVSADAQAPGLAELMQGEVSFAQVITRDKLSRLHLVMAGRPGFDRSLLQSPRVALAIDALLRAYDHVLIDAGSASDLPAELLTAHARAVVVPDAAMAPDARAQMCEQLRAVGFSEVAMLSKPVQPSDGAETPRVVAA